MFVEIIKNLVFVWSKIESWFIGWSREMIDFNEAADRLDRPLVSMNCVLRGQGSRLETLQVHPVLQHPGLR